MSKYEVVITDETDYRVIVEADSEDEARVQALGLHEDSLDEEIDSRVEGTEVTLLEDRAER